MSLVPMDGILVIRQPQNREEISRMYELRWKVLFKPWNQLKGSEKDERDGEAHHFIAIGDGQIIGAGRFIKIKERIGLIDNIAVSKKYQRKGIGSNLIESMHVTARNQGFRIIILNARENTEKFFQNHGYEIIEEGPMLNGVIKQYKMKKSLKNFRYYFKKP